MADDTTTPCASPGTSYSAALPPLWRSRDLRRPWSGSNMNGRRMSPTSKRNTSAPGPRSRKTPRRGPRRGAMPRRRLRRRPCGSRPNIACRSSTTIRWSHSAATAVWEGEAQDHHLRQDAGARRTCRNYVADVLGMPQREVARVVAFRRRRVRSRACVRNIECTARRRSRPRALKRSVRVTLTRQQMFTFGYRAANIQELALAADSDGSLASFRHDAVAMTSQFEDFQRDHRQLVEPALPLRKQRAPPKARQARPEHALRHAWAGRHGRRLCDRMCDGRARLAARMDPLELRLNNYSDTDQIEDRPSSSKELRECYRQGAEKFGWSSAIRSRAR